MKKQQAIYKIWRMLLPFIFILVLIHFVKDVTQDILRVSSVLDVFGNVKEDISYFPETLKKIYFWFSVSSFFAEIFLLVSIPIVMRRKNFSKLEMMTMTLVIYLLVYFVIAVSLDPRITTLFKSSLAIF